MKGRTNGSSEARPTSLVRSGTAVDPKTSALLRFARKVTESRGRVSDRDVEEIREAGFDDGAIAEVVANVVLNVFTNYFNNVAENDIDFRKAEELSIDRP